MNDRILGIAALIFAAGMIWLGHDLQAPFSYEPLGPRAFPLAIATIIALCGIRLVIKGGGQVEANPAGANLRISLMFVTIVAYAVIFQWAGFVIATAIMTAVVGRLFGGSWGKVIVTGILAGILSFLLFDKVLDVVLPTGLLGELL